MRWAGLSSLGVEGAGGVSMRCGQIVWVRFGCAAFGSQVARPGTQKGRNESAADRKSGLKIWLVFILSLGARSARFVGVAVVEY